MRGAAPRQHGCGGLSLSHRHTLARPRRPAARPGGGRRRRLDGGGGFRALCGDGLDSDRTPAPRARTRRAPTHSGAPPTTWSVGQIYLLDNPLLREPLRADHIKPRLLGHWGTTPGLNFIYAHLSRAIRAHAPERDLHRRSRPRRPDLHVRGYKEEGTTTTPFDMVMLNDMDRYHLVIDVIDRVPGPRPARRAAAPGDGRRAAARPRLHARARRRPAGAARLGLARRAERLRETTDRDAGAVLRFDAARRRPRS